MLDPQLSFSGAVLYINIDIDELEVMSSHELELAKWVGACYTT